MMALELSVLMYKYRCNAAEGLDRTVLRVLVFTNASVWGGSLVVVLRQGQGPDARARRRLAAGGLGLLQAAVIVAVLRGVLQVLHGVGSGESHSPVGVLKTNKQEKHTRGDKKMKLFGSGPISSFHFFYY